MSLNNIANPLVMLKSFSDLMSKNSDTLTNLVDSLLDSLINPETVSQTVVDSFQDKFPSGASFQLSDIANFQLASDGLEIVWIDLNGQPLGPLVSPTGIDEHGEPYGYQLSSDAYDTFGRTYDVHSLFGMLTDDVETNQCVANAMNLISDGSVSSLSDLYQTLPGYGLKVTDSARLLLSNMNQYTDGFKQPLGLLNFIRSTYSSLLSATPDDAEGKIIFSENRNFTIKSAFTIGWSSIFNSLSSLAGAILAFAAHPVIGALVTGTGFLLSKVSQLFDEKTVGRINPMTLNRAYNASFMTVPRFTTSAGTYVHEHIHDLGLISYYMSGSMVHFAANTTADRSVSMTIIPELTVDAPYVLENGAYTKTSNCPDPFSISYTDDANPTFTVGWNDVSHNIMQFTEVNGEAPVSTTAALQKACLSIAYTIYNLLGIMSSNAFTVTSGWWSTFKSIVSVNSLQTCSEIDLIRVMNTIASVLVVIGTGQVTQTSVTMVGADDEQWAYVPNPSITYDFDSIMNWSILSEIIDYLQVGLGRYEAYAGLDQVLNTFSSSVIRLDNVINFPTYYGSFFLEPPVTTKSSIALFTVTVLASIAVIAASAALARKAIQNAILPRMTKKYDQINAKRIDMQTLDYINNTSEEQQLADQSLLLKQTRRYNFLARILGLSTLSYTTGWENLDGRSSIFNSMSMNNDATSFLSKVSNLVQNEAETSCDNNNTMNNIVYKAITGRDLQENLN